MFTRRAIMALLAAALLGGCSADYGAERLIKPPPAGAPLRPGWIGFGGEQTISDGTRLSYWGIRHQGRHETRTVAPPSSQPAATSAPDSSRGTVLVLHGALANKLLFVSLGRELARAGWDVILVDLPGHGGSSGQFITWGAKEKFQLREFMDRVLAADKVPSRIYVLGGSMGACVAVQYAAVEPRCHGVVAVAPPKNFRSVARLMFPLLDQKSLDERIKRAGELAAFDPDDASAEAAAGKLTCPLIVVHGKLDMVVPFADGQAVYAAAKGPKKFIALDLAGHATVQLGRDDWLVERVGELDGMAK